MMKKKERLKQYVDMVTKIGDVYSVRQMVERMCDLQNHKHPNGFVVSMRYIPVTHQLSNYLRGDKRFVVHKSHKVDEWERVG